MIKKFFKFMPINQRFIPNLHRKTIISISIFRNQHPYLLFTNSKILNCFVNRQHILLPDWNHLALYSFFYIIYYEHLQIFKIGSTLSANDNPHTIAGSHRQIKCNTGGRSLLCPHRSCTVIQIDRTANFFTIRKYHYYRYASSPCVTATHFVRFFSLHTFASM